MEISLWTTNHAFSLEFGCGNIVLTTNQINHQHSQLPIKSIVNTVNCNHYKPSASWTTIGPDKNNKVFGVSWGRYYKSTWYLTTLWQLQFSKKKKLPEEMALVLQYKLPCIGGTQAQTGYKSWHTTTMENDRYMICINPHIKCLYFSPQTYKGTNVHTYCWTYDRASYLVHIDSEYNHSKKKRGKYHHKNHHISFKRLHIPME
jgi:hypothetical protein